MYITMPRPVAATPGKEPRYTCCASHDDSDCADCRCGSTWCFIVLAAICLIVGLSCLLSSNHYGAQHNTPTRANVTSVEVLQVAGQWLPDCITNFTMFLDDGTKYDVRMQGPNTFAACDPSRVGTTLDVCYQWGHPDNYELSDCTWMAEGVRQGPAANHAEVVRTMTAAIVFLSLTAAFVGLSTLLWVVYGLVSACR